MLPGLNNLAFDVSGTIDPGSWYATLLKGTLNFTPATTVLQAVAWVLYVGTVHVLLPPPEQGRGPRPRRRRAAARAAPSSRARPPPDRRSATHPRSPSVHRRTPSSPQEPFRAPPFPRPRRRRSPSRRWP